MNKDEFIENYCLNSNIPWKRLSEHLVVVPCACLDDSCEGWAMIANDDDSIKTHNQLYAPLNDEWSEERCP